MNHKRLSNHWWKVGDQRSFRKHLLISFIGKGQSVIRGMFKCPQVLFSKLLAIPLLSEEGIGKAIGMVRFESLPFSPSSYPRDPETGTFGGKKVLFLLHSLQAMMWVLLWRPDVLRVLRGSWAVTEWLLNVPSVPTCPRQPVLTCALNPDARERCAVKDIIAHSEFLRTLVCTMALC